MTKYMYALGLAGVVDAVSFMVVAPSIVFYILQCGGTLKQYGIVLSAFSFSSFCIKPLLGWWSDKVGFRLPYVISFLVATLGSFLYLIAGAFPHDGRWAVSMILLSRLLSGAGAANAALGYAYVARVVPNEKQTSVNSLLAMSRIIGMAGGPGVNALIGNVDIDLFGGTWKLDSLNSVGLVMIFTNLGALMAIYLFLDDLPHLNDDNGEKKTTTVEDEENGGGPHISTTSTSQPKQPKRRQLISSSASSAPSARDLAREVVRGDLSRAVFSAEILVPLLAVFTFNANFQLVETAFPPATADALGWGPIQTSTVLGLMSFVIAGCMAVVSILSSKFKVSDVSLLIFGLLVNGLSYTGVYFSWRIGYPSWTFYVPMVCATASFPFLAAPNRSLFTKAVDSQPALKSYHGTMQALLSMGASVAGFTTPGFVASYCLRNPEEVRASVDGRELARWTLFAPALVLITLTGVAYVIMKDGVIDRKAVVKEGDVGEDDAATAGRKGDLPSPPLEEDGKEDEVNESSALLAGKSSSPKKKPRRGMADQGRGCSWYQRCPTADEYKIDPKIAVHRGSVCECMGISQPSTHYGGGGEPGGDGASSST